MKNIQKIWLWLVIGFSFVHILRDVFQDLKIENFLSTVLIKETPPKFPAISRSLYWGIFNTYVIAGLEIILAALSLRRNRFGKTGFATIIIAISALSLWLFYRFFL